MMPKRLFSGHDRVRNTGYQQKYGRGKFGVSQRLCLELCSRMPVRDLAVFLGMMRVRCVLLDGRA